MGIKIDRTGEERYNNFGSKMIIIRSNTDKDIDIYFPEYNWTARNREYKQFKSKQIKCPYEPRVYGKGYLGEGKYKIRENGKVTKCYETWKGMLRRCYSEEYHNKEPAYKECKVCDDWLCFQNFAKWFYKHYYEINNKKMCLDKDILIKHNKLYSRETCIFVPQEINNLFTKNDCRRGKCPIGTNENRGWYEAWYKKGTKKQIYLGRYTTKEEAFQVYKYHKEKYIKEVADKYKDLIPERLYIALYNYEVEIDD